VCRSEQNRFPFRGIASAQARPPLYRETFSEHESKNECDSQSAQKLATERGGFQEKVKFIAQYCRSEHSAHDSDLRAGMAVREGYQSANARAIWFEVAASFGGGVY
jgi:hypothetical protein